MFSHRGYFMGTKTYKGPMFDENECACACRENKECIAFDFFERKFCAVYEDDSSLNQKVDDALTKAYVKTSSCRYIHLYRITV